MPTQISHVGVVVPACNEVDTLAETLDAIDEARRRLPHDVTTSLVVVLDACDDDSAAAVAARTSSLECRAVVVRERCVGRARAHGVRRTLTSTHCAPSRMWIANTDADTVVAPDWLVQQVDLARHGVDAVAGVVELAPGPLAERFRRVYQLDVDSHCHVHGANFGVRASSYLAAGGWAPLTTAEDHDLWNRLGEIRANRLSSTGLIVRTSARTIGRAPNGFAADLANLESTVVA